MSTTSRSRIAGSRFTSVTQKQKEQASGDGIAQLVGKSVAPVHKAHRLLGALHQASALRGIAQAAREGPQLRRQGDLSGKERAQCTHDIVHEARGKHWPTSDGHPVRVPEQRRDKHTVRKRTPRTGTPRSPQTYDSMM